MNIAIKVILICFICLNMWVNIMVLALKSGPQIETKTGNPAGLLFRQIWYSVGKSGVLGIRSTPAIRYPHDTIRIAILGSRYDTYRDTC